MRDTRFIFVEGIVGAGKSSTATFLTDQLPRNGIAARFMPEGPTIGFLILIELYDSITMAALLRDDLDHQVDQPVLMGTRAREAP